MKIIGTLEFAKKTGIIVDLSLFLAIIVGLELT
jgi:hypothetical protein